MITAKFFVFGFSQRNTVRHCNTCAHALNLTGKCGWIVHVWIFNQSLVNCRLEAKTLPVALISLINSWNVLHRSVLLLSCERLHWSLLRQMGSVYWNNPESICSGPGYLLCLRSTFTIMLFLLSLLLVSYCFIVQYPLWRAVQGHVNSHEQWKTLILKCCILFLEIKTHCSSWNWWYKIQSRNVYQK